MSSDRRSDSKTSEKTLYEKAFTRYASMFIKAPCCCMLFVVAVFLALSAFPVAQGTLKVSGGLNSFEARDVPENDNWVSYKASQIVEDDFFAAKAGLETNSFSPSNSFGIHIEPEAPQDSIFLSIYYARDDITLSMLNSESLAAARGLEETMKSLLEAEFSEGEVKVLSSALKSVSGEGEELDHQIEDLARRFQAKDTGGRSGEEDVWDSALSRHCTTCNQESFFIGSEFEIVMPRPAADHPDWECWEKNNLEDDEIDYVYQTCVAEFHDFVEDGRLQRTLDEYSKLSDEGIRVVPDWQYFSKGGSFYLMKLIREDAILCICVIISAFIILCINTGSLFVGLMSGFGVLLGIPVAIFLYNVIFAIKWFSLLNILAIFLVLGIGCDDVFVFVDTWKQAGVFHPNDMQMRLEWALDRSASTIFLTSFSTATAFFSALGSQIPPLRQFGLFAGCVVICDFIIVCTFMPCVMVIHEVYIRKCENRVASIIFRVCACRALCPGLHNAWRCAQALRIDAPQSAEKVAPELRGVEKFFLNEYSLFIQRHGQKLLAVWTMWVLFCSMWVFELTPPQQWSPSELFPSDHVLRMQYNIQTESQARVAFDDVWVHVVYGVKPVNSGDPFDPENMYGEPTYIEADFTTYEGQMFLREACSLLVSNRELVTYAPESACPLDEVRQDLLADGKGFPVDAKTFLEYAHARDWYPERRTDLRVLARVTGRDSLVKMRKAHDDWEKFMNDINDLAVEQGVPQLATGFQTARKWSYPLTTNENFITCVSSSLSLSSILVTIVLLCILRNWYLAFSIMIGVFSIVAQMFCMVIVWQGRSLGLVEALCCILLVGLSVDFLAHVAKAYQEAPDHWNSGQRAGFALSRIGVSILSGALTTAVGGFVLLFTQLTLFGFSGLCLVVLICLSAITALGPFACFLAHYGPVDGFGDINFPRRSKQAQAQDVASISQSCDEKPPTTTPTEDKLPTLVEKIRPSAGPVCLEEVKPSVGPLPRDVEIASADADASNVKWTASTDFGSDDFPSVTAQLPPVCLEEIKSSVGPVPRDIEIASADASNIEIASADASNVNKNDLPSITAQSPPVSPLAGELLVPPSSPKNEPRKARVLGWSMVGVVFASLTIRLCIYLTTFEELVQCSQETHVEMFTAPHVVSSDETSYVCGLHDYRHETGCVQYVTGARFINSQPDVVHHVKVGTLPDREYEDCSYECFEMPVVINYLYAWTVGMTDDQLMLPTGTGIQIGGGSRNSVFVFQMHYDNFFRTEGIVDEGTGFIFDVSYEKPEIEVTWGIAGRGSPHPFEIPQGFRKYELVCEDSVRSSGPVNIYGYSPHMHLYGKEQSVTILRADGSEEILVADEEFHFDFQAAHMLENMGRENIVVGREGDFVRVVCVFDTLDWVPQKRSTFDSEWAYEEYLKKTFTMTEITVDAAWETNITNAMETRPDVMGTDRLHTTKEMHLTMTADELGVTTTVSIGKGWALLSQSEPVDGKITYVFSHGQVTNGIGTQDEMCLTGILLGPAEKIMGAGFIQFKQSARAIITV